MRSVDLAREIGLSTQQVRNYADAGLLPPAPRTDAGYRVYGPVHRRALLAYRALAPAFGWPAARAIMRAANAGETAEVLRLLDAGHAELHAQRLALAATGEALDRVAGPAAPAPPGGDLLIGELAALLGVRTSALRVWERAGLLRPRRERGTGYRRYDRQDVRDARVIGMLRAGHHPLPLIGPLLTELRHTGSSAALREAITGRQAELLRRSQGMLTAACLLRHYLDGTDQP